MADDWSFVERVPVALLVADQKGRVLAANRTWHELTALTEAESLSLGWLAAVDTAAESRLLEEVAWVAESGSAVSLDCRLIVREGRQRPTRWTVSRDPYDDSRLVLAVSSPGEATLQAPLPDQADLFLGIVNSVIQDVFRVSLTLAALSKTADQATMERLGQAIDRLDRIITTLRSAAISQLHPELGVSPSPEDNPPTEPG